MGSSGDLNHYEIIGVERNATAAQIRSAYLIMSKALHPDKNRFGSNIMKSINAAYAILSDETKRRKYDREISVGGGRSTNRHSQYDEYEYEYYESRISRLEQQLRNTREQLNDSTKSLADSRASSKALGKKLKQLESKHKQTEAQCRQLNARVNYYESENDGLQESLNKAHDENGDLLDELDAEKKNAAKELKKEKQKFDKALVMERQRAKELVEKTEKEMLARSICYTCNGEGGNDCTTCLGHGSVQGKWTKCHNCKGTGTFKTLYGEGKAVDCLACFGKGAKEGIFHITCFQCKGNRKKKINCNVCHKGKIRGFSLKACPFCTEGNGCMNCLGMGHVSCGSSGNGHKVPPSPSSLQVVLKREADKGDDGWLDPFMDSANSNYIYYTNEWDKCRAYVSLTDYDAVRPRVTTDVEEAKESLATFKIDTSKVSFNIGLGGNNNRKGKKKEKAAGQRKPYISSPTSVLFSSNVNV